MTSETLIEAAETIPQQLPELPDIHAATLGYRAVALSRRTYDTGTPEGTSHEFINELDKTRLKLSQLDERQQDLLSKYCSDAASKILHKIHPDKKQNDSINWGEWLANDANDNQLSAFLEWHVSKIEKHQTSTMIQSEIARQKADYKTNLRDAIDDGWLDEQAAQAIDKVDDIQVYIGDIFDTLMQERGGYHVPGTKFIVIGASSEPKKLNVITAQGQLWRVTKHELNHAVLGHLPYRWLNEAATEHIALSMKGGLPDVIDPYERQKQDHMLGIYIEERELVAHLLTKGRHEIPASLLTKTYSRGPSTYTLELALEEAWPEHASRRGPTILGRINTHIVGLQMKYEASGMTVTEAQQKSVSKTLEHFKTKPQIIFGDNPSFRLHGPNQQAS